jgi:hypothetical protein
MVSLHRQISFTIELRLRGRSEARSTPTNGDWSPTDGCGPME